MSKKALITGINGQDGAYLAQYLTGLGYEVHGVMRRGKGPHNIDKLMPRRPILHYGDVTEAGFMRGLIEDINPHEIYNLAAQSHVGYSFKNSRQTMDVNYMGLVNIIDVVRSLKLPIKIYQASTSELFGYNNGEKLNEKSLFAPRSPYAIAKLAAHWAAVNARQENIFVACGILFNHESPLRGDDFVTKKIVNAVKEGRLLELGNLDARRDWGFAGDYVKAMHLMLQQDAPDDFVIGYGEAHSVRDFAREAFALKDMYPYEDENGRWACNGHEVLKINKEFYRPNDVPCLIADISKARSVLGWQPETNFKQLVKMMMEN